jgi:hypothetical protein
LRLGSRNSSLSGHAFGTDSTQTRDATAATLSLVETDGTGKRIGTPWGAAHLVEEVVLEQAADGRRFATFVQLLAAPGGEELVRFAYATGGTARRGPVTLRVGDLDRLRVELKSRPRLRRLLGSRGGGARVR